MVQLSTFGTFLKALALKGGHALMKYASTPSVMAVREILTNLLAGKLNITPDQTKRLKRYAGDIRQAVKSCSKCKKKALVVHQVMKEIAPQLKSKLG